ncbi:peptide-methionine (S)-S-oxide reductase [Actinomadura madurae]
MSWPGMRQGNDVGTQHRSAVFTRIDVQRKAAEASRATYQQVLEPSSFGAGWCVCVIATHAISPESRAGTGGRSRRRPCRQRRRRRRWASGGGRRPGGGPWGAWGRRRWAPSLPPGRGWVRSGS